tara:strand:- start:279 stop:1100 length:822 start_codon:yes stop_codon:yes gene_type:complete
MFLMIVSNQVLAGEANIVCDACSITEMKTKAKQELANSLPPEEYEGEYNLKVNVIDFYNNRENTFAVSVYVDYGPVRPSDFKAKLITSSSRFKENMQRLKKARKQVKTEVEAGGIPSSVVSSAWRIPGRSYVVNNIEDYIKSNVQVAIATTKIQSYASAMGLIKTPLPNTFRIKLDAGGYIEVKIEAAAGLTFGVKLEKIVDSDNNTLPFNKSDMKNQFYRVSPNAGYINDINDLMRNWGLSNKNLFKGSVEIHDLVCDDKGCECPDCPDEAN